MCITQSSWALVVCSILIYATYIWRLLIVCLVWCCSSSRHTSMSKPDPRHHLWHWLYVVYHRGRFSANCFPAVHCRPDLVDPESWSLLTPLCRRHTNTLCSKKSDAKIQIAITTAHLIRINYPLSSFNYHFSGTNVVNFNKIHRSVSEQQLFKKWNLKTEFSNMENTD